MSPVDEGVEVGEVLAVGEGAVGEGLGRTGEGMGGGEEEGEEEGKEGDEDFTEGRHCWRILGRNEERKKKMGMEMVCL